MSWRAASRVMVMSALVAAGGASAAVSEGRPAVGRHAGELCVSTAAAAPNCGPVQIDLRRDGSARVRIDDVTYHLQLRSSQVEVVLTHGAVQVDEFIAPYEWVGRTLQFIDDDRNVRYEVRFAKKGANEPNR